MIDSQKTSVEKKAIAALIIVLLFSVFYTKNKISRHEATSKAGAPGVGVKEMMCNLPKALQLNSVEAAGARDPLSEPQEIAAIEAQTAQHVKGFPVGDRNMLGKEKEGPVLQGLILNGKERLAIVSGKVVCEGEIVDGAKVLQITDEGVTLVKENSKIELKR